MTPDGPLVTVDPAPFGVTCVTLPNTQGPKPHGVKVHPYSKGVE